MDHRVAFGMLKAPTRFLAIFASVLACWAMTAPAFADTVPVALPPLSPADAAAIVAAWREAPEFAMPSDLATQAGDVASLSQALRAQAQDGVRRAAIALASLEHGQLTAPDRTNPNWALRKPFDAEADFVAARAGGQIAAWAAALPRGSPAYLGLRAERERYDAIRRTGGWPPVPPGPDLTIGATGPRVLVLRTRLIDEGFSSGPAPDPALYDAHLAEAVAVFQRHHRTKPDGVLNARTLKALNVPVETRLAAIDASLERARWLPDLLPANRIEVDIARAHAVLFASNRPVLNMKAIVGDVRHNTPMFASKVTAVVFNPPWNVPASIAAAELYPKERRTPDYFARHGFYVFEGRLIQRAGPKASLGLLKFEMDDPFGVYLHDTPARTLFKQHHRALSHGCMRLEAPRELAAALLAAQGWTRLAMDSVIDAHVTRRVSLQTPTPVFVVYRTAEATADGRVNFRRDIYGWDAALLAGIGAR